MRFRRSPPGKEDDAYEELVRMWGGLPTPMPDLGTTEANLRAQLEHFVRPASIGPGKRGSMVRGVEIANALWAATTRFVEMADAELMKFRLTMERLVVLREIATARAPLDMKSLARRVSVTPQTMSDLVRRLLRDGHVEHLPDAFDRRVRVVKPTMKGLYVAAVASAIVAGGTNRLATALSEADRKRLVRTLEKLGAEPSTSTTST